MMRAALLVIGWAMLGLGVVMMLVCGLALIDPAGMQAANDADPLGAPPPTQTMLYGLAAALLMKIIGVALIALGHRERATRGGERTSSAPPDLRGAGR